MADLGRILGIDYGTKRIGIAISDPLRIIARGIAVLKNTPHFFDELKDIVTEFGPKKIVVGMPYTLEGKKGSSADVVEQFISRLELQLEIEVVRCDERFSSERAHQSLRDLGVKQKKRRIKGTIDVMSAALILQDYLDEHRQ